jgi:hypothetical protein
MRTALHLRIATLCHLESEPVIEQLRCHTSLHVTGIFTRSRFIGIAHGTAWLSPVILPFIGSLTCFVAQPQTPAGLTFPRRAFTFGRRVHPSRLFSKFSLHGKAPGLRTNGVYGEHNTMCLKLMRTVSQFLKLVPTIDQQDSQALLLCFTTQSAGGSLNIHV